MTTAFGLTLRALPLAAALFTIAADGEACQIIVDDDDDDAECASLDAVCPNLACDFGNVVNDEGCAICECAEAPVCDGRDLAVPECANARFDEQSCSWFCDVPTECFSDFDCGPGFACQLSDCANREDGSENDCAFAGVCVQTATECFSDFDCGEGFHCETEGGSSDGGGAEPPNDGDERPEPAPAPPPNGKCVENESFCLSDEECGRGFFCDFLDNPGAIAIRQEGICTPIETTCFVDDDCGDGRHCEFLDAATGGLVAQSGVCVDNEQVSECNINEDCGEGQVCEIRCGQDPNCPECDSCLILGTCVDVARPCSSDQDCAPGEVCGLPTNDADARPCFDDNGDGQCDDFAPPQGQCIPVIVDDSCSSDLECNEGETCQLFDTDSCVCTDECREDGNGGCLPCECPPAGVCAATSTECFGDDECAPGQACEFQTQGCDRPCEIDEAGNVTCFPCDPILVGVCVDVETPCFSDAECNADEQCVLTSDCADGDACRPGFAPPSGTCQPREPNTDACSTVRCEEGTSCQVDADGTASCVATQGCFGDDECSNGQVCNAADVCLPPPGCDANSGEACPAVCYGSCVDPR
ncbi:MAG: Dickkopf N-terminal cysteine-rich domain-containing protein [Deltaproteobacteria bacterium]|nr:Dickkopf N-terminal cysteine-rich domain-containing protein [Deltaproteobacteria bacterium]